MVQIWENSIFYISMITEDIIFPSEIEDWEILFWVSQSDCSFSCGHSFELNKVDFIFGELKDQIFMSDLS